MRKFLGPESPTVASKRSKRNRSIFFEAGSTCGLQFYNFIIGPKKVRALRGAFHDLLRILFIELLNEIKKDLRTVGVKIDWMRSS